MPDTPNTSPAPSAQDDARLGAIRAELDSAKRTLDALCADPRAARFIDDAAARLAAAFARGDKALACGNGGSCADAMHFCEELTGRFRDNRPALPAIACADPGHITCAANDFGYDRVFARWVEALGKPGDVLVVLSTSGNSPNIVQAVEAARAQGLETIALLGHTGGTLRAACDLEWIVPDPLNSQPLYADRIQEIHMLLLHTIIGAVEKRMFGDGNAQSSK